MSHRDFQQKGLTFSLFAALLILVSCGRAGSTGGAIRLPRELNCANSVLTGAITMQPVSSTVTANSDVVWEVSAVGGLCQGYEIELVSDGHIIRFNQKGYFNRRYEASALQRTEKGILYALDASGNRSGRSVAVESALFTAVAQSGSNGNPLVCEAVVSPSTLVFASSADTQTTTALIEARRGTTRVNARLLGYTAFGTPVNPLSAVPGAYGINQNVGLTLLAPPFEGTLNMLFTVEEQGTGVTANCSAAILIDKQAPPPAPVPPSISLAVQIGAQTFSQFAVVQPGVNAIFSWNASNASSCAVLRDGYSLIVGGGTAGSMMTGAIYAAQTYTVRCLSNQGLVSERSFNFALMAPPATGRVDLKANGSDGPVNVAFGASVTISYTANNVTSCSLTALSLSGSSASAVRSLYANTVYTVNCSYWGGTTSDSVTVYVGAPDYQVVFVTEARYSGDLGGLAGADAKCQAAADASGVMPGRTFKAILPSSTQGSRDRIRIDGRVVNNCAGRPQLAANATDFWDGRWDRAASCTEDGVHGNYPSAGHIPVWTSVNAYGQRLGSDCQGWTSSSSNKHAFIGDGNDSVCDHLFDGGNALKRCDQQASLYCISQ